MMGPALLIPETKEEGRKVGGVRGAIPGEGGNRLEGEQRGVPLAPRQQAAGHLPRARW